MRHICQWCSYCCSNGSTTRTYGLFIISMIRVGMLAEICSIIWLEPQEQKTQSRRGMESHQLCLYFPLHGSLTFSPITTMKYFHFSFPTYSIVLHIMPRRWIFPTWINFLSDEWVPQKETTSAPSRVYVFTLQLRGINEWVEQVKICVWWRKSKD